MYVMKCAQGGSFSDGELQRFGNIELNPSAGVLNYGQVGCLNFYTGVLFCCVKVMISFRILFWNTRDANFMSGRVYILMEFVVLLFLSGCVC